MPSEPLRVVGYCRVSTAEQAEDGVSLLAQAERVRSYCRLYGLELICILSDPGESARTLDRPALREVLGMLEEGRAGGLVVAKLDRLTRSIESVTLPSLATTSSSATSAGPTCSASTTIVVLSSILTAMTRSPAICLPVRPPTQPSASLYSAGS